MKQLTLTLIFLLWGVCTVCPQRLLLIGCWVLKDNLSRYSPPPKTPRSNPYDQRWGEFSTFWAPHFQGCEEKNLPARGERCTEMTKKFDLNISVEKWKFEGELFVFFLLCQPLSLLMIVWTHVNHSCTAGLTCRRSLYAHISLLTNQIINQWDSSVF